MAQGDKKFIGINQIVAYDRWASGDTIKAAIIGSGVTPSKTDSDPRWGSGGSQDYSTAEVSGGNYTTGGFAISGLAVSFSAGVLYLDATSPLISFSANASNPSAAYFIIIYNSTSAGKEVYGFGDFGGSTTLVTGLSWNIAGQATGTQHLFSYTPS